VGSSNGWTADAIENTRRLDEYRETVSRLFPNLPRNYVDLWSMKNVDALASALFLQCYPRKVAVLDIGTFVGVSAFHFASLPEVSRVLSVDPNPTLADEISDKGEALGVEFDVEPLRKLRVLDVARAALAEFADEKAKIELRVGTVASNRTGRQGDPLATSGKAETPVLELSDGERLVAFVDGLHTREAVEADLETIFENNPRAVAILDDCRRLWGPFVQAGVVNFMEKTQHKYHFQLFGDLGPGIATSTLGIVYPDVDAAEVQGALTEFRGFFSERLDLLWLVQREQELISTVNTFKDAADDVHGKHQTLARKHQLLVNRKTELEKRSSRLEKRNSHLEKRNSRLEERNSRLEEHISRLEKHNAQLVSRSSSRRYKLADTLAETALRMPGVRLVNRR